MKKLVCMLLMCLCCALLCAALAEGVPEAVLVPLQSRLADGYTISAYYYHPGNARAHFVLSRDGRNQLAIVKESGDGYELELLATHALRQGDAIPVLETDDDNYLYVYYPQAHGSDDLYVFHYDWERTKKWQLSSYYLTDGPSSGVGFEAYEGRLAYHYFDDLECEASANVYGVYQREVRYLNVDALPATLQEAREKLSQPPVIPDGGLTAQEIRFTSGRKYPVYSGPGEGYLRGAGGKAAVSTNDWIQVFGREGDWLLIQYDISSAQMRFGYIAASALPKNAEAPELDFRPVDARTARDVILTDDPLNTMGQLATLPEGAWVTWLATMGEWAYVESTTGDAVRGFVPLNALTIDRVFSLADHQWNPDAAALEGTLTVHADGMLTLQVTAWRADSAGQEPVRFAVYNETTMELLMLAEYAQVLGCYAGQGSMPQGWSVLICPVYGDGSVDLSAGVNVQW